ncbi:MAG: hypothetical protein ACFFG0_37820 [Candidatus Thorarchaeota archaeon]
MESRSLTILIEKPKNNFPLQILIIFLGFTLGWLGTHYVVSLFYPLTGPICIFDLHFHHLYIGLIILGVSVLGYFLTDYRPIFLFIIAFSIGMLFDDLLDHFIIQIDPFEIWC